MATVATYLSAGSNWDAKSAGDGLCVFFFNGESDFFPGGIGSSLGYTNYSGPMAYKAETLGSAGSAADINGIKDAYVGIGFDVLGNFSNTTNGKLGLILSGVTTSATSTVSSDIITGTKPNTIGVRLGESDYYKLDSVTQNLNTYPISGDPYIESFGQGERYLHSPGVNLHQTVATRSDVVFQSARVTLQNKGKRVLVEIKDNTTGIYYPYHVADINTTGLGSGTNPDTVKVGIAFSTSDAVTNCDIKNFSVQGTIVDNQKLDTLLGPSSGLSFNVVYPNA
jgi:hypothetical protein